MPTHRMGRIPCAVLLGHGADPGRRVTGPALEEEVEDAEYARGGAVLGLGCAVPERRGREPSCSHGRSSSDRPAMGAASMKSAPSSICSTASCCDHDSLHAISWIVASSAS